MKYYCLLLFLIAFKITHSQNVLVEVNPSAWLIFEKTDTNSMEVVFYTFDIEIKNNDSISYLFDYSPIMTYNDFLLASDSSSLTIFKNCMSPNEGREIWNDTLWYNFNCLAFNTKNHRPLIHFIEIKPFSSFFLSISVVNYFSISTPEIIWSLYLYKKNELTPEMRSDIVADNCCCKYQHYLSGKFLAFIRHYSITKDNMFIEKEISEELLSIIPQKI